MATIPFPKGESGNLRSSLRENRTHEIQNFLARPTLITEFSWDTTKVAGASLLSVNNPSGLIGASAMFKNKMSGFYGVRCTTVLRVQVNSQRFQQGRLLLSYIPDSAWIGGGRYAGILSNLIQLTQLPRVELDVGTQTECVLRIPFVYPYEAYKLDGSQPQMGVFNLHVYSPLVSPTGPTDVGVTVWGHFEDVELMYPTTFVAQFNGAWEAQTNISEQEAAKAQSGPVSNFFGKISKASTVLGQIPLLSSVALPVSWATAIFSEAASVFGWSKPMVEESARRMLAHSRPYMNNCDVSDNSMNFGLMATNKVEVLPGFAGSDIDELSIVSVATRPAYFKSFTWTDVDTPGKLLMDLMIDPSKLSQSTTYYDGSTNVPVKIHTPASYVDSMFTEWRGSMCLTFKFVKTEFHSGRILAAWIPGVDFSPFSISSLETAYKEILDIRENNEFTICIPYVSNLPWSQWNTGIIALYVLNPLRAPSGASSSVSVLVEGAMGPDVAFAIPRCIDYGPVAGPFTAQFDDVVFEAQVLGMNQGDCSGPTAGPPKVGAAATLDNVDASRLCVGEYVLSLRQLLKRSTLWWQGDVADGSQLTFDPTFIYFGNAGNGVPTTRLIMTDYFNLIAPMFAFSRGGMRVKVWDKTYKAVAYGARFVPYIRSGYTGGTEFAVNTGQTVAPALSNVVWQTQSLGGALEIQIPQYAMTKMRANFGHWDLTRSEATLAITPGYVEVQMQQPSGGSACKAVVYRSVADDFDCGFFIGAPATVTSVMAGGW